MKKEYRTGIIQIFAITIASVMLIAGALFGARLTNQMRKTAPQAVSVETMQ